VNVPSILQGQQHLKNSEAQIKNTTQPRLWLEVTILGLLPSANTSAPVETSLTSPRTLPGQRSETVQPFRQENREIPASNVSSDSQTLRSTESATQPTIPAPSTSTNGGSQTPITPSEQSSTASSTSIQPPTEKPKDNSVSTYSDTPSTPPVEPSTDAQNDVDQIWQQVLAYLPLPSKALFSQHGYLVAFNGQQAQIGIRAPKLIKMAQPRLLDIELAFQKAIKQKVNVILAVNQPSTAQSKPDEGLPVEHSVPKASFSTNTLLAATTTAPEDVANNDSRTTSPTQVASSRSAQATIKAEVSPLIPPQTPLPAQDVTPKLESPTLLVSDWDVDEVDKVLGNLKQFFEGEIIDLADDFPLQDIAIAHPLPLEEADLEEDDSLSEVTARLEASAMPLGKPLQTAQDSTGSLLGASQRPDFLEPATAHQLPSSKISAPNNLEVSVPGDGEDDDDIPF
jgi:DNA polymerase-3 subunit gamma/tau